MSNPLAWAKYKWKHMVSELNDEFYRYVGELLENEQIMQLDNFTHHHSFTRLGHSLDVAYVSFVIARFLKWDARSTARAGLLHDMFFYDWRDKSYEREGHHVSSHPLVAIENAKRITILSKLEENIILRHMWLVTLIPPRYKEGYIVTFVDKACALHEGIVALFSRRTKPRAITSVNW